MSKWLSIELSLLLLVSLVAFAGFVSWQNNGDDLTGEAFYRPYRPPPRPVYVPPQPVFQLREVRAGSDKANILGNDIGFNQVQALCDVGENVVSGGGVCNPPGNIAKLSKNDIPFIIHSDKIGMTNAAGVMTYGWAISCVGKPNSSVLGSSQAIATAICTKK